MAFESRRRKESPRWVAAGVISPEQAERLHALHPEADGAAASRFLTIISLLGAVLCVVAAWRKWGEWRRLSPWLVNLAIACIALNLFTRYFDIFSWMLNQGLMFLVSGAVVLGLDWYLERKRRALLGVIHRGGATRTAPAGLPSSSACRWRCSWAGRATTNGTAPPPRRSCSKPCRWLRAICCAATT